MLDLTESVRAMVKFAGGLDFQGVRNHQKKGRQPGLAGLPLLREVHPPNPASFNCLSMLAAS